MANDPIANEDPFKNMIGTENDLNHIMSNFVDSANEIMNFWESQYIDMCDIESALWSNQNEFVVLSLNIQSIKAKFDNFFSIINSLSSLGIFCRSHLSAENMAHGQRRLIITTNAGI